MNMTTETTKQPPFVTFYSFKGGVGRTMALANVACILAGRGRRVLCMDMDLAAPGLTYLGTPKEADAAKTPGFVDMIHDLLTQGLESPIADESRPHAFHDDYTRELRVPEHALREPGGRLCIMPAGRMDKEYGTRLAEIDLGRLYELGKGKPILAHVHNVIARSGLFDYVLIDSRTGFSDEAGISVRDLGDHLVVLMGLNRQNVVGTRQFIERLKHRGVTPTNIAFVASPVPVGEDELRRERIELAERELGDALGQPVKFAMQIPYHPRLALDEDLSGFRWSDTQLWKAYEQLEAAVRSFAEDTAEDWLRKAQASITDGKHDLAVEELNELRRIDRRAALLALQTVTQDNIGNAGFTPYFEMFVKQAADSPDVLTLHGRHLIETDRVEEGVGLLEQVRAKYEEDGQREKMAYCDWVLGGGLAKINDWPRAEKHLTASLAYTRETANQEGIVSNLRALGELRVRKGGDDERAVADLREAAEILELIDNPGEAARVLAALAVHQKNTGEYAEALSTFRSSLRTFEDLGKSGRAAAAAVKTSMGQIRYLQSDYEEALALYAESLAVQEELGDRRAAAVTRHSIADVHLLRGEHDEALALYQESLAVKEELGDRQGAAVTKSGIADIHRLRGEYDEALRLYHGNLAVDEELDDRRGAAATKHSIADIHQLRGEYDEALRLYQESLAVNEELGDRREAAVTKHCIADIRRLRGEHAEALGLYQKSLAAAEELGDLRGAAVTQHSIARIHQSRGDYQEGPEEDGNALDGLRELGEPEQLARARMHQARLAGMAGDTEGVREALDEVEELATRLGARHLLADAAVLRAQLVPDGSDAQREGARQALEYYRSQQIHTEEARAAEELAGARAADGVDAF